MKEVTKVMKERKCKCVIGDWKDIMHLGEDNARCYSMM